MNANEVKLYSHYNRKTKRELIEILMYVVNKKRLERESLVNILYELQKLSLSVDNNIVLPESEKREIITHINEIEIILKFNISEFDKKSEEE